MMRKTAWGLRIGAVLMTAVLLAGCGAKQDPQMTQPETDKPAGAEAIEKPAEEAPKGEGAEEPGYVGMVNPWHECTEEEAREACFRLFKAPEGAEVLDWMMMEPQEDTPSGVGPMVQLDFKLDDLIYCARAQQGTQEDTEIHGLYYDWDDELDCTLANWGGGNMKGKSYRDINESGMLDLITWYDIEVGISYSLSTGASDLSGFDIQAIAEQMYDPSWEPVWKDAMVTYDAHAMMTTEITGCDTFTQIVDNLPAGKGYTTVKIGDEDVLLVASGTYEFEPGKTGAIDAEAFIYADGDVKYIGAVNCGGTAYPLAIKDGLLYTGGNHYMYKLTIKDGAFTTAEEAIVRYDTDGNASYDYRTADTDYTDYDQATAEKKFGELFGETDEEDVLIFDTIVK